MFKKKFWGKPAKAAGSRLIENTFQGWFNIRFLRPRLLFLLLFPALMFCAGCQTASTRLQPIDLKEPGWTVHEGQAVWHLPHGEREIAGDVLVATRPDGRSFVQFSKSPFPLVTAQSAPNQWAVEFPPQNKHYAGKGEPPKRLLWLYLPRVLSGIPPPNGFTWHEDSDEWRLENKANKESLEGFFAK